MSRYEELPSSPQGLQRWAADIDRRLSALERRLVIRHYASADRPDPTTSEGMLIYNTTTSKGQGSNGATWNDLY